MHNRTILFGLYLFFLLATGWLAYKKPLNNWDAIVYSAVVLQYDNASDIHTHVYQAAKQHLTPANYILLTSGNNQRKLYAGNSHEFYHLMPFYVVKPLYTRLAWLFYRCGFSLFSAVALPSVLAYILIGVLVFVWLGQYLLAGHTFALSAIIMLLPNVQEAARLSTPDLLFTFFILSGMYFIIERRGVTQFFISLILAMFCRIDGVILLLVLLAFYTYVPNYNININLRKYMILTGISIAVYFTIACSAIIYGWNILYFPSFLKTLTSGYSSSFTWHGYIELVKAQLFTALYYSHLLWIFLLGAILLISNGFYPADKKLLLALFITIVIRFTLLPVIADRFYLPYCFLIIILMIRHLKQPVGSTL